MSILFIKKICCELLAYRKIGGQNQQCTQGAMSLGKSLTFRFMSIYHKIEYMGFIGPYPYILSSTLPLHIVIIWMMQKFNFFGKGWANNLCGGLYSFLIKIVYQEILFARETPNAKNHQVKVLPLGQVTLVIWGTLHHWLDHNISYMLVLVRCIYMYVNFQFSQHIFR